MMFDEEREELQRQARQLGEYQLGDPEKATGSTATWAESVPEEAKPGVAGPEVFIASARYHLAHLNAALDTLQKVHDIRFDYRAEYSMEHRMSDRRGTWTLAMTFVKLINENEPAPF